MLQLTQMETPLPKSHMLKFPPCFHYLKRGGMTEEVAIKNHYLKCDGMTEEVAIRHVRKRLVRHTIEVHKQTGVDFSLYLYIPEVDPFTNVVRRDRGDHNHVFKRIATSTRNGKCCMRISIMKRLILFSEIKTAV